MAAYSDVLIIGAGISGIGAAHRICERNPDLSYTILERRERVGGTWDLFRYPGIRSDSDIYTLCFPWEPWTRPEMIADGEHIWQYIDDTTRKHGIDRHIRFNTHVRSADWDWETDTWTVQCEQDGEAKDYRCRWLFFGTGYFDYDEPYRPEFPGIDDFAGEVLHPQHWPESFDWTGKRVVVIGSGATAVSLIPSLTADAAHVTMLQRTPSYMMSTTKIEPTAVAMRKVLPLEIAHWIVRWRNALLGAALWGITRSAPELSKRILRRIAEKNLPPGYPIDEHFKPPYNPWDQRLCFIVGADLYKEIADGRLEMVTDRIDFIDVHGLVLASGRRIDADVIITATGLQLQALGGVSMSVGGEKVDPHERFLYRRHMLEDVPNAAWCVGYTNASWTLGADLTAQSFARLVAHMRSHGYTNGYPHLAESRMPEQPAFNLESGYVKRGLHALPRSGTRRPWMLSHNFVRDALGHRFESVEEAMVFGRNSVASVPAPNRYGATVSQSAKPDGS